MGNGDIKLFIKDEPHKITKIKQGRQRLISCLCFEDQIIDRLLFYPWQQSEVNNPDGCASKTGWSVIPAGYAEMLKIFIEEEKCLAVDKSAWDWTMPPWVVMAYLRIKFGQTKNKTFSYMAACFNRFREVVGPNSIMRLPTGRRLRQLTWGLMKSGWFLTLSLNSFAQDAQHVLACERMGIRISMTLWAMGDDSLIYWTLDKKLLEEYLRQLATTGCLVKFANWGREFCGFRVGGTFDKPLVEPLYPDKHKYNLAYLKPKLEKDTLLSYSLIYGLSKQTWLREFEEFCPIPMGIIQSSWARGLIDLKLYFELPPDFDLGMM